MSRKGENIYKRKDGRWEARYIKAYSVDGKAKYGYCYASSYREVREKSLKFKASLLSNQYGKNNSDKTKFSLYCDEWLQLNQLRVKESTYVKYCSVITKHIKPGLGGFYVSSLNSLVMEEFCQNLLYKKGLSPKTVKDTLVLLKSILKYTQKNYYGYMDDIEITYPKEIKKEMRVLSREEQQLFTRYLLQDMDNIKFGILLTMMTGLRIGEICALRWSDISIDKKVICVKATMQRIHNTKSESSKKTRIVISSPKSNSSVRMIPLTENAAKLCRLFYKDVPDAYILSGSSEWFVEPRTLQYKLANYTNECGLQGVHYHTLRHSFATRCVEVDFEIKSLSEILGHASTKITLDRYVHSSLELKRTNMNKLNRIGL